VITAEQLALASQGAITEVQRLPYEARGHAAVSTEPDAVAHSVESNEE
jgi:hypothetical protein